MDGFRKEYIGGGVTVFVSQAHTFGTDAVLLADFASPSKRISAFSSSGIYTSPGRIQ